MSMSLRALSPKTALAVVVVRRFLLCTCVGGGLMRARAHKQNEDPGVLMRTQSNYEQDAPGISGVCSFKNPHAPAI